MTTDSRVGDVLAGLDGIRPWQEDFYRDLHHDPELSHQEHRTAARVAERLRTAGFEVREGVGGTGVVGVLQNGVGPTVLMRADMDALPVRETTGLPYASETTGANSAGEPVPVMLNVRTYFESTRTAVLDAIRRIVTAECQASGSPREPDVEFYDRYPLTTNDPETTDRVAAAFANHFGDRAVELPPRPASEDFSDLPNALGVPYTYWGIGGIDADAYRRAVDAGRVAQDVPVNHSGSFAPVIQPTLDTGTEALVVAALAWL